VDLTALAQGDGEIRGSMRLETVVRGDLNLVSGAIQQTEPNQAESALFDGNPASLL
jgi:hypothetical protein